MDEPPSTTQPISNSSANSVNESSPIANSSSNSQYSNSGVSKSISKSVEPTASNASLTTSQSSNSGGFSQSNNRQVSEASSNSTLDSSATTTLKDARTLTNTALSVAPITQFSSKVNPVASAATYATDTTGILSSSSEKSEQKPESGSASRDSLNSQLIKEVDPSSVGDAQTVAFQAYQAAKDAIPTAINKYTTQSYYSMNSAVASLTNLTKNASLTELSAATAIINQAVSTLIPVTTSDGLGFSSTVMQSAIN